MARLGQKLLFCIVLVVVSFLPKFSYAQVVNGDFSAGATGWTDNSPGTTDSNDFSGNQLTSTSNNIGAVTNGPNLQTFASQGFTAGDAGFLSYTLVSYASGDTGDFDFPIVVLDGVQIRIRTDGTLSNTGTLVNNANQVTNVSGVTTLAAGARTIGFGVRTLDSGFGPGIAVWDNIDFQEITQSPAAQSINQGNSLTFSGVDALAVADNTTDTITVTLSVTNGIVTLGSIAGITITAGANGSSSVTFTGTSTQINTALDGLVYTPNSNFIGSETLAFTASGGGISDTDNISIEVFQPFTITKSADDTTDVIVGQTITYTYVVTNTGVEVISNISLFDAHNGSGAAPDPADETLTVDSIPSGNSTDSVSDNGIWDTLAPGDAVTFTGTYIVTQSDVDTLQ